MRRKLFISYAQTLLTSFAIDVPIAIVLIAAADGGQGRGYTTVIVTASIIAYTILFAFTSLPVAFLSQRVLADPVRRILTFFTVPALLVLSVLVMLTYQIPMVSISLIAPPLVFLIVQIVYYRRISRSGLFEAAANQDAIT